MTTKRATSTRARTSLLTSCRAPMHRTVKSHGPAVTKAAWPYPWTTADRLPRWASRRRANPIPAIVSSPRNGRSIGHREMLRVEIAVKTVDETFVVVSLRAPADRLAARAAQIAVEEQSRQ